MNKLAITYMDGKSRTFARYTTVLGASSTLESVGLEKATLFDDPEAVEHILHNFDIIDPKIEVISISHVRTIESRHDKYKVFLGMIEGEVSGCDYGSVVNEKTKKEWTDEDKNYPMYLFAMLWHEEHPRYNDLEHDLAYEMIVSSWRDFTYSVFDDPNKPLYECVQEYFEDKRPTRVMIRKVLSNPQAGDTIAFFLDNNFTFNPGTIGSYMHTGQHSCAVKEFVVCDTVSTKSGCSVHGCLVDELKILGYSNIEIVKDLSEVGYVPKCLYCDSCNEPTHFICESCGDGMCDQCYDADKEHIFHYQDPSQGADGEDQYLSMDDSFGGGYGCDSCVEKVVKMVRNMEA